MKARGGNRLKLGRGWEADRTVLDFFPPPLLRA